jgi:hypothetical protein
MKIPVSKLVALCGLRLLRILLEKAMCFVAYLIGMTRGCEVHLESPGHKDQLGRDNNQTLPPYRFD